MERKKFFRRKNIKSTEETENVSTEICNINIVCEAEKIIEDYVNKMGYNFKENRKKKLKISLAVLSIASLLLTAASILLMVFSS